MPKGESVEDILARLMPVAMSETAEAEIAEQLDVLAAEAGLPSEVRPIAKRWPWITGAAAALAACVIPLLHSPRSHQPPFASASPTEKSATVMHLSHSDLLEAVEEEGWWEDDQGNAHQSLRLRMVAHQEVLDQQTGIRMTVIEPREETILVPVSTF